MSAQDTPVDPLQISGPEILAVEAIAPGASKAWRKTQPLSLLKLRDLFAHLAEEGRCDHLPEEPPPEEGDSFSLPRSGLALAFCGGSRAHIQYALPLIEMFDLPMHLFVPLEKLGEPGWMTLGDLDLCARNPLVCVDLDLCTAPVHSSRDMADELSRSIAIFEAHAGARPYYVWIPAPPRDSRFGLLLEQHGFVGAVSLQFSHHHVQSGLWMWAARRPSWRARGAGVFR